MRFQNMKERTEWMEFMILMNDPFQAKLIEVFESIYRFGRK